MARSSSRKRKAAGDNEPRDPQTLIDQARQKEQRNLKHSGQEGDRDHPVRTVQAILATNKEIWERYEPHRFESVTGSTSGLHFCRDIYRKIKVETRTFDFGYSDPGNTLSFTTKVEFETRDFGVPDPPPERLTRILALSTATDDGFPDYEQFFHTSLLLHDDVLLPFLAALKEHLESIQVFLGTIDAWLMHPHALITFIEENFGKTPEFPRQDDLEGCGEVSCELGHEHNEKCLGCGVALSSHNSYDGRYYCPGAEVASIEAFFLHWCTQDLKECKVKGEHREVFDISEESEREGLVKFLAYVSHSSEN